MVSCRNFISGGLSGSRLSASREPETLQPDQYGDECRSQKPTGGTDFSARSRVSEVARSAPHFRGGLVACVTILFECLADDLPEFGRKLGV